MLVHPPHSQAGRVEVSYIWDCVRRQWILLLEGVVCVCVCVPHIDLAVPNIWEKSVCASIYINLKIELLVCY